VKEFLIEYNTLKLSLKLMQEHHQHQASQRRSGRQLDKPAQIFENALEFLRDLK
jgi:hypothetical protein